MTTPSTDFLSDSMKAGLNGRPAGRLRDMVGRESPGAVAIPLSQDAYEIAIDHVEPDPQQPRYVNAVAASVSPGSWLPVTDCQCPGKSARSISSTRGCAV
jgi:hypothetical protein